MGKRYPIYPRKRGQKTVYVLDYGRVYDPTVGRVRRKQRQFQRRKDAETERDALIRNSDTSGPSASLLSVSERSDARRAIDILKGKATLTAAAEHFLRSSSAASQPKHTTAAVAEWIQSKVDANRRPSTVKEAEVRGGVLVSLYGDRVVSSITTREIAQWLAAVESPGSRRSYRTLFHGFWEFAVARGWAEANIIKPIPVPARDDADPAVFNVRSVIRLLRTTERTCPELIPYFAIGIFAGLRPVNELAQLDCGNVSLRNGVIRVVGATAKRRRKRLVDISPNLRQ